MNIQNIANKITSLFLLVLLGTIFILKPALSQEESDRDKRRQYLYDIRDRIEIKNDDRIYRSDDIELYMDKGVAEQYGLDYDSRYKACMLRIFYIIEEAYNLILGLTESEMSGRLVIEVGSPGTGGFYRGSWGQIKFPHEAFMDPLDDFSGHISDVYYMSALVYIQSKQGAQFDDYDKNLFSGYIARIGQETSSWNHQLSQQEKELIIEEISKDYYSLYRRHPDFFSTFSASQKKVKCPWCGAEIETEKEEGQVVTCPQCKKNFRLK